MKITYLDPIHSKADKEATKIIKPLLSYEASFWKKGPFNKTKQVYTASMIDGRSGLFLTGFLPKINEIFDGEIDYSNLEILKPKCEPFVDGVNLRDYQIDLIKRAIQFQRGIIKAPTGVGKTIISIGLMSCFPLSNILFLCNNISILQQTMAEMEEKNLKANFIQGKNKNIKKGINVASIQTFSKIDPDEYATFFDILIVDECQYVNDTNGLYGNVIQNLLCPMRIGLSATPNDFKEKSKILSQEGLLGPIIGELTIKKAISKKMFVKPTIKLVPVPFQGSIGDIYNYQEMYLAGIVNSEIRNSLIVNNVVNLIDEGKTCLILIKDIQHGENLMQIVLDYHVERFEDFLFIKGDTDKDKREEVRQALEKKELKVVIATAVWYEGVDIKSLDSVVIAAGGKSTLRVLQNIGRSTRVSEGKTEALVIDFLDPYKYLSSHCIERLSLYVEKGWL